MTSHASGGKYPFLPGETLRQVAEAVGEVVEVGEGAIALEKAESYSKVKRILFRAYRSPELK